jgi:hypothetical protein
MLKLRAILPAKTLSHRIVLNFLTSLELNTQRLTAIPITSMKVTASISVI